VDKFKDLPEVKNAKSFSEAARLAKKAAGRLAAEALGRIQANAVPLTDKHRVLTGKAEQHLVGIPPASVDCIIADPPYGVGANKFGEQSRVGHTYEDEEANFWEVLTAIEDNASRICKAEAALFLFVDILMWPRLMNPDDAALNLGEGWYVWPTPLIWYKTNKGHAPQPTIGPSRRYEAVLYAVRGGRKVRKTGSDVLPFAVPDNREHAAGKPVDLYKELLSWIVFPGDLVVDPCAGSGTVISAAHSLDCRSIAVELDPANATLCNARIEEILSVKSK
jgi:DNA modification methylase